MTQLTKFDYKVLLTEDRLAVREASKEIKDEMHRTALGIVRIGESLADVQGRLARYGKGSFQAWLEIEFGWGVSTAYRFIHVYERFGVYANLAQMKIAASALYVLAAPSTPEGARAEAVDRAQAGETITHRTAQGIIGSHKPAPAQPTPIESPQTREGFNPVRNALTRAHQYALTQPEGWHTYAYGNYQDRDLLKRLKIAGYIEADAFEQPDERLRITTAGCKYLGKPLPGWLMPHTPSPEPFTQTEAYDPSDPAQNPLAETHPHFGTLLTNTAICPDCGSVTSRWKAEAGGFWRCPECEALVLDDVLEPYTRQDVDAEARMAQRRNGVKANAKPKQNYASSTDESNPKDRCQTPDYAVDPLLPFLNPDLTIWEPAAGEGLLVDTLYDGGIGTVVSGDLLDGQNFFDPLCEPEHWDILVTNPPYSTKYGWLARCYALGKPFALLMPIDVFGSTEAQALFHRYGVEVIFMNQRIDFKMPEKGWDSSAQFSTAWFTWGLEIGRQMTFADIYDSKRAFIAELEALGLKGNETLKTVDADGE